MFQQATSGKVSRELQERLYYAVSERDYEKVRQALLAGANPNQTLKVVGMVDSQYVPVLFFLWPGSHSILRLLLLAGANPNATIYVGADPHATAYVGRTVAMAYIMSTFLMIAQAGAFPTPEQTQGAVIELLIAGADPRIKDARGQDLTDYINRIPDKKWRKEFLSLLQLSSYRTERK